ncbi:GreA/GreB family elongation factor [Neochlamydia sp. EPS4]|uniref:GreA/GreB family elongation factor n=1 Tax=Neochlamydia sp. EPS4 TaxID=1478175 RepID=UPI0005D13170|nr:GreA/GreB family elongation factor [Neochlamydia sp. EPS4]
MGYLEEFQALINHRNFAKFLQLWEEYCTCDIVEVEELDYLLKLIKTSDFAAPFGKVVETALPLWEKIEEPVGKYQIIKLLIDLQTTHTPRLAEIALEQINQRYQNDPLLNERLKLVGLRTKENFQSALSNYDLIAHMAKGKFVFHTGGWGTGEIVDISALREQVTIEFENVTGRKYLTYANAFKTLIPLEDNKFLARRFSNPDKLEQEAKENAVEVIKLLLRDLGPKNAAEIKEELCELVIPENEWAKWWQATRNKIKKDPLIESPSQLKEPFRLRKAELTADERMAKALQNISSINEFIQSSYNFVRDLPNARKNQETKNTLKDKLLNLLSDPTITPEQELQIYVFLESMFAHQVEGKTAESLIKIFKDVPQVINSIEIQALRKRVLGLVKDFRPDWPEIFLQVLFSNQQSPIRDYILKELNQSENKGLLKEKISHMLNHPFESPETFVWYFQKLANKEDTTLPFHDKEGLNQFFEAFLVLLSHLESKVEYRDLVKKIYNMIINKRYALVRFILEGTSLEFIKEFLLLVSKCQTFTDHDNKILRSLAEVVHPTLAEAKHKKKHGEDNIIWTTEEGYMRTQERIRQIGTVEMVENAREVEAARALGDLRENSEYKFAVERRARLQGELKVLSDQLKLARIITKDDILQSEVGIGSVVEVVDSAGNQTVYKILGPWDANPEEHILSFQSKYAQAMLGCKEGEAFKFRDENYSIAKISSFLGD